MHDNRICALFNIRYPIIQGGMIWCASWKLASAVSNAGGLGLIGSGSMKPEVLRMHIKKCKENTQNPFGVNIPLMYPDASAHMRTVVEEEVPVVFTSAGSPSKWTSFLQAHGIRVAHVVSSARFAKKADAAGVDAIVAEGFEAGGHNGREETTTLCLIPLTREATAKPLIAAGGIGSGKSILAVMTLGAEGVQIGSLFAASKESSAHDAFKEKIIDTGEGETHLALRRLSPVRLIHNDFYKLATDAEYSGASEAELQELLGKARSKKGMFEGDLSEGELEIGQVSAQINSILSAKEIMDNLIAQYRIARETMQDDKGVAW